jgi:hypothetical protein
LKDVDSKWIPKSIVNAVAPPVERMMTMNTKTDGDDGFQDDDIVSVDEMNQ